MSRSARLRRFHFLFLSVFLPLAHGCTEHQDWTRETTGMLSAGVIEEAARAFAQNPKTITSYPCDRSTGGLHDFYSESDYWWPDPENPDGPFIQRDGENNPAIFSGHRQAVIRFSRITGTMASAYLLTGNDAYAARAMDHARAWFIDSATRMNPNLLYAQAIRGISRGRRTGIVDAIQLIEAAQGLYRIQDSPAVDKKEIEEVKKWFAEYTRWISTHPYGIDAMNSGNNHAFCWILQMAVFARFTDNAEQLEFCRQRMKNVLFSKLMDKEGGFPAELSRNKPYACSLFTLDIAAAICHVLSTGEEDLWRYVTDDGKSIRRALAFHAPYIRDKNLWPYPPDINHFECWPVAQISLLFGAVACDNPEWFALWQKLPMTIPPNSEVERNFPIRHPLIWL